MTVVKWTPVRELENLRRNMERLVDEFVEPFPRGYRRWWPSMHSSSLMRPNVEVIDRKDHFSVRAELPGLDKKDLDLTITKDTLVIKGESRRNEDVKEEDYYMSEITYGKFARTLSIPSEIESEKAKATFKNGVLEIVLPKKEKTKSKEIKVDVS